MMNRVLLASVACIALTAAPVLAADVNGDEFFFTIARPPGFVGPQPAVFGDGTVYTVGLDFFFQLVITPIEDDPNLAVRLMRIRSEPGLMRDHALVVDFEGVIAGLPQGYPVTLINNTTIWFDDLESTDVENESPPTRIGNLVMLRASADAATVELGNPLRLPDGTGVTSPTFSDDFFDLNGTRMPQFNVFGEGLVFTLTDWRSLLTHPVYRIEFDLVPTLGGDIDRDGDVDLSDYLSVQAQFTGAGDGTGDKLGEADIDGDGDVDLADVLVVLETFTGPVAR